MISRQVKWVQCDETDKYRRIARLGGDNFNHSIIEAITSVRNGTCPYWMVFDGAPIWVLFDTSPGPAYIRTELDISEPDILLTLAIEDGEANPR